MDPYFGSGHSPLTSQSTIPQYSMLLTLTRRFPVWPFFIRVEPLWTNHDRMLNAVGACRSRTLCRKIIIIDFSAFSTVEWLCYCLCRLLLNIAIFKLLFFHIITFLWPQRYFHRYRPLQALLTTMISISTNPQHRQHLVSLRHDRLLANFASGRLCSSVVLFR